MDLLYQCVSESNPIDDVLVHDTSGLKMCVCAWFWCFIGLYTTIDSFLPLKDLEYVHFPMTTLFNIQCSFQFECVIACLNVE